MPADRNLLSHRLDLDWRALAGRPDAVARANSWGVVGWRIRHLDELLLATGFEVPHTPACNEVLGRIVARARHDELAGRIAMQRVLPGLVAIARKRRLFERDAFEELAGAAWLAILGCRTEGKEHIAAYLVRDAAYRAFTAPGRRRSATEIAVDPRTLDEEPSVHVVGPCEELALLLADARESGVPEADIALISELADVGSPGKVARLRNVTPRTIRNRRERAAARLRHVALDAA
jgi:hypothetical protein